MSDTDPGKPDIPVTELRKKAASVEALGLTGIVFALLCSAAVYLTRRTPGLDADDATIQRWLADSGNRNLSDIGSYLALFAAIALLWFIGTLRRQIGDREDQLFATVFLGSGLCFIALMLAGVAANIVPVALYQDVGPDAVTPSVFRTMHSLGAMLLSVMSTRMAALVMLSMSNLGRITRAFPAWLTTTSMIAGVVMLFSATLDAPMVWVFPAWAFIVGVAIIRKRRALQIHEPSSPAEP